MGNALVSVIIPVYNHEKYVQQTIESIINQSYQNIEIIIIDDGSKDSSFQKILELKEKCEMRFVRTVIETKENEGTCKTYNKLLEKANGKYIYLIASDDISKPDAISKEVEFMEQNNDYVLVVGDNEIIDKNGDLQDASISKYMQNLRKINFCSDIFGTYPTLFFIGNYIPNGYMVRKSALDKFKFTPNAPLEDYYEHLQLAKYGKFKFLNEVLFSYRIHGSNTMTQSKKMRKMARKTFKHELEILKNTDFSTVLPQVKKTYLQYRFLGKIAKFIYKFKLKSKFV